MSAAVQPQREYGAIPRTDNTGHPAPCAGAGVTWKLGKSVDSIDEEADDGDDVNTKLIENNNNDDANRQDQDHVHLARAGTSCVR